MEHIDRHFKVALHILHPEMDPELFSTTLFLTPKISKRVGDNRKSADGSPLEGTYSQTFWSHNFDLEGVRDLFSYVDGLLESLKSHKDFFQKIYDTGGRTELFCGIFTGSNWDEILPVYVSHKLVSLQIDLRLDVYPKAPEKK